MTHVADILTEAFDYAVEELDGFLTRLTAADPVLELEREGDHWLVENTSSGRVVFRAYTLEQALGLAATFVRITPGARLGDSFEGVRDPMAVEPLTSQAPVTQAGQSEPVSLAGPGVSVGRNAAPPDSFSVRVPSNVIPIGGRG